MTTKHSTEGDNEEAIFGPFLGTMVWTAVVWTYMYSRRIPFILDGLKGKRFTPEQMLQPGFLDRAAPEGVRLPSDNLKNLLEVPVLFYGLVLYLYVTKQVDRPYVTAAWVFCAFRALHSVVHCTPNHDVRKRFYLYLVSTASLWYMVLRAAAAHVRGGRVE
jgi:hypothetical protein